MEAQRLAPRGVRASVDFNGPLNALSTSPNNRFIAVGGRDGALSAPFFRLQGPLGAPRGSLDSLSV